MIPHNVTGARVIDLLELTGLEKRMVGEVNKINLEKISYYDIQPIINHKIEESKEFLLNKVSNLDWDKLKNENHNLTFNSKDSYNVEIVLQ